METINQEKQFDAIHMMREARNKISAETQNMSFEELKAYIQKQFKDHQVKPVGGKIT